MYNDLAISDNVRLFYNSCLETRKTEVNLVDIIIPFTVALFVIAVGVVLLYQNFQKNLIEIELEKAAIEAKPA